MLSVAKRGDAQRASNSPTVSRGSHILACGGASTNGPGAPIGASALPVCGPRRAAAPPARDAEPPGAGELSWQAPVNAQLARQP
jgi:hypothetical protein